jgi:hypothetical protein
MGGVSLSMEKTCENCEYFVQASGGAGEYERGKCVNPETCIVDEAGNKDGILQWKGGTCIDFKPRKMEL